jgi:hypothetical protein
LGSEYPWHQRISPRAIGGMCSRFCSSLPYSSRVGPEHHHAHAADRVVGAGAGDLLGEDGGLLAGQPAAAVFLGPGGHAPAARAHRLAPSFLGRALLGRSFDGGKRVVLALEFGREVSRQERAHFLAEGVIARARLLGFGQGRHRLSPQTYRAGAPSGAF